MPSPAALGTSTLSSFMSNGVGSGLSNLLGSEVMTKLFDTLGSKGFASLVQGLGAYKGIQQTGDMMDFTKNLATKQEARTQKLFQDDQEDQAIMDSIDYTQGF